MARGGRGEGNRLLGLDIKTKEGLGGLEGGGVGGMGFSTAHLSLRVASHPVGIDGERVAGEMSTSPSESPQSDLEGLRFGDGMGVQEMMDRLIGSHERKSIGDFKALLVQGPSPPNPRDTQGRFVHQLQSQARFNRFRGFSAPPLEQIPSAQAQIFRNQEPETHQGPRHLVVQKLPNPPFQTRRVTGFPANANLGSMGFNGDRRLGLRPGPVEFFFEARSPE